jgi:hypothetical protein
MIPVETLKIHYYNAPATQEAMPMIAPVFQWLGIPMTTATLILVMFAAWGVWHWVIMAIHAGQGLGPFISAIKGYLDKKAGDDDD